MTTPLSKKVASLVATAEVAAYGALGKIAEAVETGSKQLTQLSQDTQKMTINLTKGSNINLSKEAPSLKAIRVGLGWDENQFSGADFDLDASVIMVGESGKLTNDGNFVFFRNLKSPCGAVVHLGDNLTGGGEGDDEVITVDLSKIPADITRVIFAVNIYNADDRKQNFGMVQNAFIRLLDEDTSHEVARYDLTEDASTDHAMVFAELYKHNGEWKFKAVGQGFKGPQSDLGGILPAYR